MEKKYSKLLKDERWQETRKRVLERDGYRCRDSLFLGFKRYFERQEDITPEEQECREDFDDGIELHVHHCFYEKGAPWETGDEYLITVGKEEHIHRHEIEDRIKRAVAKICANTRNKKSDGYNPSDLTSFAESLEAFAETIEVPCGRSRSTLKPVVVDHLTNWHGGKTL